MSVTGDMMELREADIRKHYPAALSMLQGIEHMPRVAAARDVAAPERSAGLGSRRRFRSTTPGLVTRSTARAEAVQLVARIEGLGKDDLPSPVQAAVLQGLRRALAIALAVGEHFAEATGGDVLKRDNLSGALGADRKADFTALLAAEALVVLGVFGSAVSALLSAHAGEEAVEIGEVEEVLIENPVLALHGAIWELDADLDALAGAEGQHLVAVVLAFAEGLLGKVALRAQEAARLDAFTSRIWRVEADDLTIDGFVPQRRGKGSALTMQFKAPHEVIGNHIAKYQAMKLAKMLMAYDFERRLNPFAELGGFIFTFMGDGAPGTGKTTLIQMMAGLVHGYAQTAGYPFRYQNFSIDQIDSYQGKSGQNAKAFVQNVLDPSVIGFGTIDDIDQIAGKRGDRQSSAGQQEVTAVFMEAFAGANTVVRGNCTFGMFSNFPENVDDALRQRAGARFLVDGPQSRADYIDILHLLLGKGHDIPLGDHDLMAAQEIKSAVSASFESHGRPSEDGLVAVWDKLAADIGPLDTIAKLGTYLKAIQRADARFTGRAIKNITDAVKVRALDVDLPDAWMENPELFLWKPYDDKLQMIREMTQPITVDMVVQEINRYADSEFRYADKSDDIAIENAVREMERMDEAKRRYRERNG